MREAAIWIKEKIADICVATLTLKIPYSFSITFRYHIGLAFQVVDDILDLTGSSDILGKPAMADMRLGLATALLL